MFTSNPTARVLSGVPTEVGTADYIYTVTNSTGIPDTITFRITVRSPFTFESTALISRTYTAGTPVALTLPAATGGTPPLTYQLTPSSGSLADGLAFDTSTHVLSGTPTTAHPQTTFAYTVTDSNSLTGAGPNLEITISEGPPPTFGTATIPDQTYTQGTAIPDLTLPAATVGTGTTPLAYTLSRATGPFNFAGLTFDAAPDARVLQGTPTTAQSASVTYTVTDAAGRTATLRFLLVVQNAFSFEPSTIPAQTYTAGTPIPDLTLPVATGGTAPLTYQLDRAGGEGVPDGLSFNGATRVLSGTPTTAQAENFYIYTVMDSTGLIGPGPTLQITIREPPVTFGTTIDPQIYLPDTAVSVTLPTATGGNGTLTYAITEALPTGLAFDGTTRVLSGTTPATEQAVMTYTYTATDSDATDPDTAQLTFTITITDDPPVIVLEVDGQERPVSGGRITLTVDESEVVTLDASGSSDPEGGTLMFLWAQNTNDDIPVTLSGTTTATATFTAPDERTTLNFDLRVTDDDTTPTLSTNIAATLIVQVGRGSERALQKTLAAFGRAFATGTVSIFEDYLSTPATSANTSHFTIGGHKFDMATTTPSATVGTGRDLSVQTPPSFPNTPTSSFPNDRKTGSDSDHVFHRIGNPVEHDLANTINSANLADTTSNGATTNADTPATTTTTLMSGQDLLMQSAFHLNLNDPTAASPGWSFWGRATTGNFNGDTESETADAGEQISVDGSVDSGYLGIDYLTPAGTRLGLAIAQSDGEIDYDEVTGGNTTSGDLEAKLTSILPYLQWQPGESTNAWLLLGYGTGDAELATDGADEATDVDIDMQMLAFGLRGDLDRAFARTELSWKASAFAITIESDDQPDLGGVEADSQRLRFAVEGRRPGATSAGGGVFTPGWELGMRWEDGDIERGAAADAGLRFDYTNPTSGWSLSGTSTFVLFSPENYDEWTAGLQARLDPGAQGRGITFTLEPGWTRDGRSQQMGMDFSNALGKWSKRGLRLELTGERTERDDNDIGHNIRLTGSLRF